MYSLGIDLGSSSVKVSILDINSGKKVGFASAPKEEMRIIAEKPGWAEQNPPDWWKYLKQAFGDAIMQSGIDKNDIKAIGISYQMHGLVIVDKNTNVLRNSIIWCDSRATEIGENAYKELGNKYCKENLLNSPGNFTASKLRWVQLHEPIIYKNIHKLMLPGDYIAMKLSGKPTTTASGLSEGIMWNMVEDKPASNLLKHFSIDSNLIPEIVPTFGEQGKVSETAAKELGLKKGTPITYRAGDQPNNAFSLNVLEPGEIAATAGTSGVVYGITDIIRPDESSRVNTFLHVNHNIDQKRFGVLLCLNGTGILYNWLKKVTLGDKISYYKMNELAEAVEPGSDGLLLFPFGNGAERMLNNQNNSCTISSLNFNIHTRAHLYRAALEGIACSFKYGMDILKENGIKLKAIRAGNANLFLSRTFREILATVASTKIELYDTDGSQGAARAAAYGAGYYKNFKETFRNLEVKEEIYPINRNINLYENSYQKWYHELKKYY